MSAARCTRLLRPGLLSLLLPLLTVVPDGAFAGEMTAQPGRLSGGAIASKMAPRVAVPAVPEAPEPGPIGPLSFIPGNGFTGYDFTTNITETSGYIFIPPDPIGAAGLDRLVAVVNVGIECKSKTGTLLFRESLQNFFSSLGGATLGTFTFDPKVVYDPYEDRFVVVALEMTAVAAGDPANGSRILIAVSKTASPATATSADWWFLAIDSLIRISGQNSFVDYPGLEVDEEAVYITGNMFPINGGPKSGDRLWIIDKGTSAGFYAGGTASYSVESPVPGGFLEVTLMPAKVFSGIGGGSTSPTGVGTYLVGYDGLNDGATQFVEIIRINDPLGSTSFTAEYVDVGNIDALTQIPDAPQFAEAHGINTNDRRALDAVWRDDALWLTATFVPTNAYDATNAGEATAHWFKLDTSAITSGSSSAGLLTLADQGNIGGEDIATGTYTFFPSVAVNHQGTAKFGFAASAASIYCGAYMAGREAGDPAGTVQASGVVQAGLAPYYRQFGDGENRWGDYSGISVDPADERVFWVFNEYAWTTGTPTSPPSGTGRWKTAWRACAVSCFTPLCPADTVVTPGDTASVSLCFTNCGGLAETFSYVVSDEAGWCSGFSSSDPVAAGDTACITVDCTVPSNACAPDSTIIKIVITSSAGDVDSCTTVVRAGPGNPIADLAPPNAIVGAVAYGDTTCQVFTVHNLGCGDLDINSVTGCEDNGFFLDLASLTTPVPGGDSTQFQVCFSPVHAGAESCSVSVVTNAGTVAASIQIGTTVAVPDEQAVTSRLILAARPNPFGSSAVIRFVLPSQAPVTMDVFDSQGRRVRNLARGEMYPAGEQEITWDGRTDRGSPTVAGVYFIKLAAGAQSRVTRAVKLQ